MDYSFILKNHNIEIEKLLSYGFQKEKDIYVFKKDLSFSNLYAIIKIAPSQLLFEAKVFDSDFDEEYILYTVSSNSAVKNEVELLINDIKEKCFESTNIKEKLIQYISQKYQAKVERPWEKYPNYVTFKTPYSDKWFAIMMDIEQTKLDNSNQHHIVNVMNVKQDPNDIPSIIDNTHYFSAYHMSKKSWISIVLDQTIHLDELYALIDKSFQLVEKVKKNNIWIVPANPKFYDLEKTIETSNEFLWKQSSKVVVNDLVFIYLASPYSSIQYLCKVTEVDIPYDYQDDNLKMKKVMRLKVIKTFDAHQITFNYLNDLGINAIRGPIKISQSLYDTILKEGER